MNDQYNQGANAVRDNARQTVAIHEPKREECPLRNWGTIGHIA